MNDNELLTTKEVRNLLKVGKVTLYNWEKNKKLIPINFSQRLKRYKYSDIVKFINKAENKQNDQE